MTGTGRSGVPRWLERCAAWARARPLLVDVVFALVLAATLGLWTVWLVFDPTSEPLAYGDPAAQPTWRPVSLTAVAVAHVAVVWRRARPPVSFALVTAATGVQLALSIWWFLPSMLVALVSLYSFAAWGPRAAPKIGLFTVMFGTACVTTIGFPIAGRFIGPDQWLVHVVVRLLPFVMTAWSLGLVRRIRVAYVAALVERAERAEAEREERARRAVADERARIAREMHDVVAHALSVVISQADGGRYAARNEPERGVEALTTIGRTGRQALADMRGLLRVLRTGGEDEQFPHPTMADLPELFERVRAAGLPVELDEQGTPDDGPTLSPATELAVFRTVQEALTNTLKHAGDGARAWVRFAWSPHGLDITVRDNGTGASTDEPGHGLVGMRERLAVVGGTVSAHPASDRGFVVSARVPRGTSAHSPES